MLLIYTKTEVIIKSVGYAAVLQDVVWTVLKEV
jgi:hypothetical protein